MSKLGILKATLPKAPLGRRPIGYRGNHQHGKSLYDPVYPTTKIPTRLIPRYPIDWRNGGRFLLCVGLRRIENRIIKKMKESHNYNLTECKICDDNCVKIYNRCLCAWFCKYKYRHVYDSDNLLMNYKGEIKTNKPIFTIKKDVAKRNMSSSLSYKYNEKDSIYQLDETTNNIYNTFYEKIKKGKDATLNGSGKTETDQDHSQGEKNSYSDSDSDSDSEFTDSDEEL